MATTLDIIRQKREAISDMPTPNTRDNARQPFLSSEVRFYGVDDLVEMLGWSRHTVLKLFNDPEFPASDFGKAKIVEAHALIEYFSVRRCRDTDRHWSGQEVI